MNVEKYIDHTLLKATATPKDIEQLCAEANACHFAFVPERHTTECAAPQG